MALVDEQLKKKKLVSKIASKSQPKALITIGTPSTKIDIRIEGDRRISSFWLERWWCGGGE